MRHFWITSISPLKTKSISQMISDLGFMDDANWISSSIANIEEILATADEFYIMTSSAINRDKTKILTNVKTDGNIKLRFGRQLLDIKPESKLTKFLGVWMHPIQH